jgi:hypothetical protein
VKFPTGGMKDIPLSPRVFLIKTGFGEIPKPTVKSGWEKMRVSCNVLFIWTFIKLYL